MQEDEEQAELEKETNRSDTGAESTHESGQSERNELENDDYDYDKKSDTAEDFSEINELAEDLQSAMLPEKVPATGDNYDDNDETLEKIAVKAESTTTDGEKSAREPSTNASDETKANDNDKELMPPPSVPLKPASR